MVYVKQAWVDGVAGGTPISAARLAHIEDGIEAAGISDSETITELVGDGVADDAARINDFLTNMPKGRAKIPAGLVCRITASVVIPDRKGLVGQGYTPHTGSTNYAGAVLLKDGNFDGVVMSGIASFLQDMQIDGATGNGGDGVYLIGQRSHIDTVAVTGQGGDGVRIGAKVADGSVNTNLWRATNIIVVSCTGNGFYIHDHKSSTVPDANAGLLLGLDVRSCGGDGLRIGQAIDNQIHGLHSASNTGYGFHLEAFAEGNYFWAPYTESNVAGEGILDANSQFNVIFGTRSNTVDDNWVDNGSGNLILGRDSATNRYTIWPTIDARDMTITGNLRFGAAATEIMYRKGANQIQTDAQFFVGSSLTVPRMVMTTGVTTGTGYWEALEQSPDVAAPAATAGRVFFRDNGSGKTQMCVRFATGAIQVLATEP